ncbi:uncharacterized protein EI97DRAFT_446128 [Westerdykella ornata]|uniref:Uncharacterized protein n=1 Tax=Westerdykella ornata TaxID=318751 RepID=A0A6A6J7B5_WESOR|nr:uncharacterized protein EI97DRAFT_446128 [Westerdykella ornata]KAF2272043.1 hypothetical protein EI97DRAFT_446128 [Westerdykella ornata]
MPPPPTNPSASSAYADLSTTRYDKEVAAIDTRRDTALLTRQPVTVAEGRAPKGLEAAVFQWKTLQFTIDEDKDAKEEGKEDLHGGQLHRQNRVARGEVVVFGGDGNGNGGRGGRGGKRGGGAGAGGGKGKGKTGEEEEEHCVRAGCKPGDVWPCAKGFPEELERDMFL